MRHFLIADTHGGHGNIMKYCNRVAWMTSEEIKLLEQERAEQQRAKKEGREFDRSKSFRVSRDSVARMDTALIHNINQIVQPDDILWMLGDFCFNECYAKQFRDRLHVRTIHFFWGNHDPRPNPIRGTKGVGPLFSTDRDLATVTIFPDGKYRMDDPSPKNINLVLCHYAMAIWEGSHKGFVHLYGHSHSGAEEWLEKAMPGRRAMDVGVDNAFKVLGEYRPFALEEIMKIMESKPGKIIDQHGS